MFSFVSFILLLSVAGLPAHINEIKVTAKLFMNECHLLMSQTIVVFLCVSAFAI